MAVDQFQIGDKVRVIPGKGAPVRYEGRSAQIVNVFRKGKRVKFGLDFTPRRADVLFLTKTQLRAV